MTVGGGSILFCTIRLLHSAHGAIAAGLLGMSFALPRLFGTSISLLAIVPGMMGCLFAGIFLQESTRYTWANSLQQLLAMYAARPARIVTASPMTRN